MLAYTANVVADFDLGVPVTLGMWYGLEVDLNAIAATVHSRITNVATGSTLADLVSSLPASWNPAVDGRFDVENFVGGELTALTTSGLAVVDNIDTPIPEPATMLLQASALAACVAARRWK